MPQDKIPVVELFGPTMQGEGKLCGQISHFIRFGVCTYRCSWCDSFHAVLPKQIKKHAKYRTQTEIYEDLEKLGPSPWVTLTGGDPCVWDLMELCCNLRDSSYKIAVETQGAFYQEWLTCADLVTCSPKPPSSGMVDKFKPEVIQKYVARLNSRMIFKVVIFDEEDLQWAIRIHKWMPKVPLYLSVGTSSWLQHDERLEDRILGLYRALVERIFKLPELHDAVILPQMHALLWGRELGR